MNSERETLLLKICEKLQGTTGSLDNLLENEDLSFDELTTEETKFIDDKVMCCHMCGWWEETALMIFPNDIDPECPECHEEVGEDEE